MIETLRRLLFGTPFGEVFPPRPDPPIADGFVDGRTVALQTLGNYLTQLRYFRPGSRGGPPIPVPLPPDRFHVEMPNAPDAMVFPCLVCMPLTQAKYVNIGLTTYIEEKTRDKYARGTVLQWLFEYQENFLVEVWTEEIAERRALVAGIEQAMSPVEQAADIRFRMPAYFNEPCCFSIEGRSILDVPDSAKKRRCAQIEMRMFFTVVKLVNYVEVRPQVELQVGEDDAGLSLVLDAGPRLVNGQLVFGMTEVNRP